MKKVLKTCFLTMKYLIYRIITATCFSMIIRLVSEETLNEERVSSRLFCDFSRKCR